MPPAWAICGRPPPLLPTALIGLAQTTGFQLLVQSALVEGGAGRTALLAYTMPFWVVLLGWVLYAERPSSRLWIGLGIAAAGLVLVLEPWLGLGGAKSSLLALAGGLAWACGVVWTKRLFQRGGVGALSLTAWQMAIGTLGVVVVAASIAACMGLFVMLKFEAGTGPRLALSMAACSAAGDEIALNRLWSMPDVSMEPMRSPFDATASAMSGCAAVVRWAAIASGKPPSAAASACGELMLCPGATDIDCTRFAGTAVVSNDAGMVPGT